jgi:hypothetical protein
MMAAAVVAVGAAGILSACGLKQTTDDMHDATMEMNQRTKRLGELSEGLDKKTAELYDSARQGAAWKSRHDALDAMKAAPESASKIASAAAYFQGFEFQLWSGLGQDDAKKREELINTAASEFMRDVQNFIKAGQKDAEPFAHGTGNSAGNLARCLNALAVVLHTINPKQTTNLEKYPDHHEVTMYSMIKDALRAKLEIETGQKRIEQYPGYVHEFLANEQTITLLLQARYNFFGAMAVGRVSNVRDGAWEYLKMVYGDWFSWWKDSRWEMNLADANSVEVSEFSRYLKGAMKTREFMLSVGIEPKMSNDLARMLKNMKVKSNVVLEADNGVVRAATKGAGQGGVVVSERLAAEAELIGYFEQYRRSGLNKTEAAAEKLAGSRRVQGSGEVPGSSRPSSPSIPAAPLGGTRAGSEHASGDFELTGP